MNILHYYGNSCADSTSAVWKALIYYTLSAASQHAAAEQLVTQAEAMSQSVAKQIHSVPLNGHDWNCRVWVNGCHIVTTGKNGT